MATKSVALMIGFAVAMFTGASGAGAGAGAGQPPEGYAWAAACKDCHADIHAYWEKSKHGRALLRLRGEDQNAPACVNCHVTGGAGKVLVKGDVVNGGVQCESCHGPSAAHVANPTEKPPARVPAAAVCESCHHAKSPHFRGFFYQGMLKFGTHPVK